MTKRLQVLFEEDELKEIRAAADAERVTVAEWVRQALRRSLRESRIEAPARRLLALREAAARYAFPVGEPEELEAEIERGYGDAPPP